MELEPEVVGSGADGEVGVGGAGEVALPVPELHGQVVGLCAGDQVQGLQAFGKNEARDTPPVISTCHSFIKLHTAVYYTVLPVTAITGYFPQSLLLLVTPPVIDIIGYFLVTTITGYFIVTAITGYFLPSLLLLVTSPSR